MEGEIRDIAAFLKEKEYVERNPEILRKMAIGGDIENYDIYFTSTRETEKLLENGKKDEAARILEGRLDFLYSNATFSHHEILEWIWRLSCSLAEIYMSKGFQKEAESALDKALDARQRDGWSIREEQIKYKEEILSKSKKE